MVWGQGVGTDVARGRALQRHCPGLQQKRVLAVGLAPATSAVLPPIPLSGRTSQGHRDRRILLRTVFQVHRSHPAKPPGAV